MPEEILGATRRDDEFYRQDDSLQSQELFGEVKRQVGPGLLAGGGLNERQLLDFMRKQAMRAKISQFERNNDLQQGDLSRAVKTMKRKVTEEKLRQKTKDLELAANPQINPQLAIQSAGLAGIALETEDQVKAARPLLKRMSRTLEDSKLTPQQKKASLEKDKQEINQIMLRSTVQGGRRGVAVTGETAGGRRAEELGGFRSEPLAGAGAPGRFFPEPAQTPQRSLQRFMQTLEPETTLLRGEAGQREIAGKKQRNKLRIEQWQAGQPKQTVVPGGARIFETTPGKARPLTQAPLPTPPKRPTTIESALLEPGITPKRQKELVVLKQALRGKGFTGRLTMPDGTVLEIGEAADTEITKPVQTEVQKEMRNAKRQLEEIERIEKSGEVEEISGLWNRATIAASNWAEFIGGKQIAPEKARLDKDFNSMMRIMKIKFRKAQTGVAFNPIEAKEYDQIYPNLARDGAEAVKFKLQAIRNLSERVIRSGRKFVTGRNFLDAFAEEVQKIQLSPGGGQSKTPPTNLTPGAQKAADLFRQ